MKTDLGFLQRLVEIHSGSKNSAGVDRVQDLLADRIRMLGFQTELVKNPNPQHVSGHLLVATLAGDSPRAIDFITHADTVEEGVRETSPFRLEQGGQVAVGPGALDDKSAQVQTLQALEKYLDELKGKRPPFTLRWISAPSEELGSPGFQTKFRELGAGSRFTLGFEPALENGSIISARRGNRWYHVRVDGKGGHSGRAHAQGVNAALDLSLKFSQASALTDYARELTVSIGAMHTSTDTYNVIVPEAVGKLDVRFRSFADRDQIDQDLRKILAHPAVRSADGKAESITHVTLDDDCPPFEETAAAAPWRQAYLEILSRREGGTIGASRSGGAADCCYMSRPGLCILDGLGPRGGKMHDSNEFVLVDSIATRAEALVEFLVTALPKMAAETEA